MSEAKARKIVAAYAKKLKEEKFPFDAIYLFGSFARKNNRKWSDIDVAVFSDRFKENWNDNEELLWKIGLEVDPRIEPLGFTKNDFQNNGIMVSEIRKEGIRVA